MNLPLGCRLPTYLLFGVAIVVAGLHVLDFYRVLNTDSVLMLLLVTGAAGVVSLLSARNEAAGLLRGGSGHLPAKKQTYAREPGDDVGSLMNAMALVLVQEGQRDDPGWETLKDSAGGVHAIWVANPDLVEDVHYILAVATSESREGKISEVDALEIQRRLRTGDYTVDRRPEERASGAVLRLHEPGDTAMSSEFESALEQIRDSSGEEGDALEIVLHGNDMRERQRRVAGLPEEGLRRVLDECPDLSLKVLAAQRLAEMAGFVTWPETIPVFEEIVKSYRERPIDFDREAFLAMFGQLEPYELHIPVLLHPVREVAETIVGETINLSMAGPALREAFHDDEAAEAAFAATLLPHNPEIYAETFCENFEDRLALANRVVEEWVPHPEYDWIDPDYAVGMAFARFALPWDDVDAAIGSGNHPAVDTYLSGEAKKHRDLVELVPVMTPLRTGTDDYVLDCFTLDFVEYTDTRDWSQDEELAELQQAQFDGDPEVAKEKMLEALARYRDFDVLYLWLADTYAELEDWEGRFRTLLEGLLHARSKVALFSALGTAHFEWGDLPEAVKWWVRSCAVQLGGRLHATPIPFLNLAELADTWQRKLDGEWLLARADEIDPRQLRLNDHALDERYQMAVTQADRSMADAISRLREYYGENYP